MKQRLAELGALQPETWPPRHRAHKYWGRKPANLVSAWVDALCPPGGTVLDPFAGSGVTLIEAARLGRKAVGVDTNPVAVHLARSMASPADADAFARAAEDVIAAVQPLCDAWFHTRCGCGRSVPVRAFVWDDTTLQELRYTCACGASSASPTPADIQLASACPHPADAPDGPIHPGWQMRKLVKAGLSRWSELFTARSLTVAAALRDAIHEHDGPVRDWLLLTLTASLAQHTRMIADFDKSGPSWKINCYWLPRRWQELNPVHYFRNRVTRSVAALRDLHPTDVVVHHGDSRRLPLPDASVDYVFTDPPYGGEGVQYGELSMLWALWLDQPVLLDAEVAFNPKRGLRAEQYGAGLVEVFADVHRVLRPGAPLTVTFANKDVDVVQTLIDSVEGAGFEHVGTVEQRRSAPAVTQHTSKRATRADLYLTWLRS